MSHNVSYTLRRLLPMGDFTPVETRRKLVTSLIVPQFLYCDIIFCKSSMKLRERLKLAFNSCVRYIYSISRFQHISPFANKILGVPLDTYYSFRVCCAMFRLIKSGCPGYLYASVWSVEPLRRFLFRVQFCETAFRRLSGER
jgi:hypothetical protein